PVRKSGRFMGCLRRHPGIDSLRTLRANEEIFKEHRSTDLGPGEMSSSPDILKSATQSADVRHPSAPSPVAEELPVILSGTRTVDKSDKRELFTEETKTLVLLPNGAVLRTSQKLAVDQLVFLTNKQTGREIITRVVKVQKGEISAVE